MQLVRESISFQRYKDPKDALFGARPKLQIGDYGVDKNNTIVKVIDIITKKEALERDDVYTDLEEWHNDDYFYVTITLRTNKHATSGEENVYAIEDKRNPKKLYPQASWTLNKFTEEDLKRYDNTVEILKYNT